ncbi:MAG: sortase B protein-sorting domain-containing protein [Firmicutes bacterium]|nr:sortase B protein-sorting domain-containing protein [Bacillota bacterium]
MTKKNFTKRITSMVCAAVLSAGLAVSSLPAGALAVYAEENAQVQEVPAETTPAETSNAGEESAEPQPAAASPYTSGETPVDAAAESASSATEAPATETPADEATNTVSSGAPQGDAVETEAPAESAVPAADEETPGETTALTELASKAEAVAATEQADDDRENSETETTEEAETSAGETVEEESVSENNTADTEDSTPVNEADNTDTEETEPEEDAEENTVVAEEEVSPALALRALAVSTDAAAGTLEESETADEKKVKIDYDDQNDIHSVKLTGQDGKDYTVVLFCMNNQLHWPHKTDSITPPEYKQSDINDFKLQNGQQLSEDQKNQIKALLYAGYPNNGFSLFQIVEQDNSMDVGEFNKLLIPPAWIRSDFPDLGAIEFTYENSKDNGTNKSTLSTFLDQAAAYYQPSAASPLLTPSGHTYAEIQNTSFWKAAFYLENSNNPISDYSTYYGNGTAYVTEKTAHTQTNNAIWHLMYKLGVEKNNISSLDNESLAEELYNYSQGPENWKNILETKPADTQVTISGDGTFKKEKDGLWKTGTLILNAPGNQKFTLTLPDGVTTEDGNTEIMPGTEFALVTKDEPANKELEVTAKANVVWMDGDLKIYTPAKNITDSAGKGFQSMIGALIRKTPLGAVFTLSYKPETTEEPENPTQGDNNTPPGENPSEPEKETPTTPAEPTAPDTPTPDKNNPATSDNTTNNNTETTDPVTNNTTEPSDPVVTKTTVVSTPVTNGTTAADEPAVINTAVSAPVVTKTSAASAPQTVSTPVSKGQTIVTGDESQMGLYLSVFAAAAAGLAVWFARKHKKNCR